MMNDNYIVYKHTSPNNKSYIGITSQTPERRWRKNGEGYKNHLYFYRAIQKYGWDKFKHEILFEHLTKEEAEQKEIELITFYKSNDTRYGYNLSIGGESGSKGYKYTKKQRENLSLIRQGSMNPMYGKNHTQDSIEKNRIAHLRESLSEDTIIKMSNAKLGKKRNSSSIGKQIETISKPVICVETAIVYPSAKQACLETSIDSSSITKVCIGKRKIAGGFHWCYADKEVV